jgi:hypothetical protein
MFKSQLFFQGMTEKAVMVCSRAHRIGSIPVIPQLLSPSAMIRDGKKVL